MTFTLKKTDIVRGRNAFQLIFKQGKEFHASFLHCFFLVKPQEKSPQSQGVRVGFAVSRTVRRAVDRNRIKRLMRESYRMNKHIILAGITELTPAADIAFLYTARHAIAIKDISLPVVEKEMKRILSKVASTWSG